MYGETSLRRGARQEWNEAFFFLLRQVNISFFFSESFDFYDGDDRWLSDQTFVVFEK